MNPDPELDITVFEDINHLSKLWQKDDVSNCDIRNSSHILRRLLIYNDLQKVANFRQTRLMIEAPNNKALIKATRNKALEFFQSGGINVLGVWIRAYIMSKGTNKKLNAILKDFDSDEKIKLNISSFLKQPVFAFKGELITRADVIKYVANKAGGHHFDKDRKDKDKLLDFIRSAVTIYATDNKLTIRFDINALKNPQDTFNIINGAIDPVFVEMAATCRYLTESESVIKLSKMLKKQYGL